MKAKGMSLALGMSLVACLVSCNGTPGAPSGSAAIVGRVVSGGASKFQATAQVVCPTLVVTLNGSAADVAIDDDCSFLIDNVAPAAGYVVGVSLPDLEVEGTVTISNVLDAELIEIEVDADDDSLSITIVRRATPDLGDDLPSVIPQNQNNVEIFLPAGTYANNLTVIGNNFTLVGEAGDDCDDEGWTLLSGDIVISGNNATFRNILFLGNVQVSGNNTSFINVCFDGQLIIFGRNTDFDDDDDGDDDDNSNDNNDDDGNDNDDDDGNGNDNVDDNGNNNGNDNGDANDNDNGNGNDNVDDGNQNSNENSNQNGNDNSSDDNGNGNENDNGNDNND